MINHFPFDQGLILGFLLKKYFVDSALLMQHPIKVVGNTSSGVKQIPFLIFFLVHLFHLHCLFFACSPNSFVLPNIAVTFVGIMQG